MGMEPAEFITIEDAARELHVTVETLRKYVRQGRFPAARVGRRYLLRTNDVIRYVRGQFPPDRNTG